MTFPLQRPRRLRRTPALRRLVAETRSRVDDLVAPLFVREGIDEPQPIASLPGVVQHTRESLRKEVAELAELGVPAVILFGVPARKDPVGSEAWNPDGIVQVALRDLRDEVGDGMVLMADCCLDEYTDHGHCGVLTPDGRGRQRRHPRAVRPGRGRPGRGRGRRRRAQRDDGRPGRAPSAPPSTPPGTSTPPSSPTRPSTPRPCTARSATPSTCGSPAAATARATSRTGATPARRWSRSRPTWPRAPTW